MQKYNIVLVRPPAGPAGTLYISMAFQDIGRLLLHSFESLGVACTLQINTFDANAVNVVLGYHLLEDVGVVQRFPCIIYQLEQLPGQQGWLKLTEERRALLRAAIDVWDFSTENTAFLAEQGVQRVKHLPFGFHEKLQTIAKTEPDIDVLFYGAINARRKTVLNALAARCKTKALFGVYGDKRDRYIGRSKIVLNLHHYQAAIMEQPRVSYLLNNRCFVVSEESAVNPFAGALVTASYEELAECCLRYLNDPAERARMAEAGFAFLAQRPMAANLRAVLE